MPDNEKRVCVPLEEREENEVDRLQKRIKEIQENCEHDFRLVKEPKLSESLVKGVFVGHVKYWTESVEPSETEITLICLKCNKKWKTNIFQTCPFCLHIVVRGEYGSIQNLLIYFGYSYNHSHSWGGVLNRCTNCDFALVSDGI